MYVSDPSRASEHRSERVLGENCIADPFKPSTPASAACYVYSLHLSVSLWPAVVARYGDL